jgi:hypothetical protein
MLDSLVETAVGNSLILTGVAAISCLLLAQYLLSRPSLSHIPRYDVAQDGKPRKKNEFINTSDALREAYPKVSIFLKHASALTPYSFVIQFSDWEVHGPIKLSSLQNILRSSKHFLTTSLVSWTPRLTLVNCYIGYDTANHA